MIVKSVTRLHVLVWILGLALFLGGAVQAGEPVPNKYVGHWTGKLGDCNEDVPNGVEVIHVFPNEVNWWEIGCSVLSARETSKSVHLAVNCIKGGGIPGAGIIELQLVSDSVLKMSIKDLGFQVDGSSLYHACQRSDTADATWLHNGSLMTVREMDGNLEIRYSKPRPGMVDAGVTPGDLLFAGRVTVSSISGTAFIFNKRCGPLSYRVSGKGTIGEGEFALEGEAPIASPTCHVARKRHDVLRFQRRPSVTR